jgi:hypothetical protein
MYYKQYFSFLIYQSSYERRLKGKKFQFDIYLQKESDHIFVQYGKALIDYLQGHWDSWPWPTDVRYCIPITLVNSVVKSFKRGRNKCYE